MNQHHGSRRLAGRLQASLPSPAFGPVSARSKRVARRHQRGVTLIGLLFWAVLVGFAGYVVIRTVPTLLEYRAIQATVDRIAAAPPATVAGIRQAFERQKDIEYSIETISGKDLDITKENDRVVISFAYHKEVELIAPVFLLIKYEGRSK